MNFRSPLAGFGLRLQIAIWAMAGVVFGMAVVVTRMANATSYLSESPETCMNCHVMTDAYATWQRGSHAHVTVCTDCHVPHTNHVAGVAFKATDGLKHSYVFTLRLEPQVLRLSPGAVPVVQENCLRCHSEQLSMIRLAGAGERKCWDCHENTHGAVQSLSASPSVLRPQIPSAGLPWMKRGDAK